MIATEARKTGWHISKGALDVVAMTRLHKRMLNSIVTENSGWGCSRCSRVMHFVACCGAKNYTGICFIPKHFELPGQRFVSMNVTRLGSYQISDLFNCIM